MAISVTVKRGQGPIRGLVSFIGIKIEPESCVVKTQGAELRGAARPEAVRCIRPPNVDIGWLDLVETITVYL